MVEAFLPKQSRGGQDPKNSRLRQREDQELLFRWVQRLAGKVQGAIPV